jgi:hypothetical protein
MSRPRTNGAGSTAWHGLHPAVSSPPSRSLPPDRRGRLRNGNRPGDFLAAPRCGARTRCGGECRQPGMANGRCRMHGGLSTGPRTPEGLARSRRARLTHGGYSAHVRNLRAAARAHAGRVRALAAHARGRPAWHGVDRSGSALILPAPSVSKVNHRAHRDHRGSSSDPAREARNQPSSVPSVRSVVNPSPAGHGVHPSNSKLAARSTSAAAIGVHLRSPAFAKLASAGEGRSAAQTPSPAWHGLHRSFRDHLRSSSAATLC